MIKSQWSVYDNQVIEIVNNSEHELQKIDIIKAVNINFSYQERKLFSKYLERNLKRILDNHEGVYNTTNNLDVDNTTVKHLWLKNKNASVFIKNPNYIEQDKSDLQELRQKLIDDLKEFTPTYPFIKREQVIKKKLFVLSPADIHIGKVASVFEVGEDYNNQIAVKRVLDGCSGLISELTPNHIEKILFVIGNDILHIDNPKRTTTSGTPQDTDGMWFDCFLLAKKLYVDVIEMLLTVADVHIVFNPSNHDYTNGFFLAQIIQAHFKDCKNITFDCSISHRKYYRYGNNLIGTTHGDGAKESNLAMLMAHESKDWQECKHKYFYIHHYHHKIAKDYMSVCVEVLRSPSGTDSWHHRNGYQHSPKAIEGFIHDFEHGQIARLTHLF
jgi:hypothetical protein